VRSYPSLYQPGTRNSNPPEVQAQHQLEAYGRLRELLGWAVNHIAAAELGHDYVTIPDSWDDETVERYATARELAFPNPVSVLYRKATDLRCAHAFIHGHGDWPNVIYGPNHPMTEGWETTERMS
jgi:hypothetical protein